jgi:hypothetical protein
MMADDNFNQNLGIWRSLGDFKLKDALWPEGLAGLVIGAGGSALVIGATALDERVSAMGTVLALAGGFFGVVFTALAILVSLASTSYLRMLHDTPEGGIRRFLDPFLVALGTQIAIVLLAVAYRLVASHIPLWIEHLTFGLVGFLFVFGVLDIAALARQLVRHGMLRAIDAVLVDEQGEASRKVHRLPRSS